MNRIESNRVVWACALFLLASPLTFTGCNPLGNSATTDGGPTTVSGQVVGEGSAQAVPHAPQVQLWQRAQATGSGNPLSGGAVYAPQGNPQPVDGHGRFSFGFQAEAGHEYVLRAEDGGLGYYTDWALAPAPRGGQKNEGLRVPVAAPAWVRVDLVDELPKSRVGILFSGFGGNGLELYYPRDTTLTFRYLTGGGRETFLYWRITPNGSGQETTGSRTFTQAPLDTQRIRIPF